MKYFLIFYKTSNFQRDEDFGEGGAVNGTVC
jgi:hypothetical protein